MKIGITSMVCEKNHKDAIQFSSDNGIDIVQIYLSYEDLKKGDKYLLGISEYAVKLGIDLITHVHENLDNENLDKIARKHCLLLTGQENKISIIHFKEGLKKSIIEAFNKKGITIYVENYHRGVSKKDELLKHDEFLGFVIAISKKINIGAVIDFPRYFSGEKIDDVHLIIELISRDLMKFYEGNIPVMFHTIGKKSFLFGRGNWTVPGDEDDLIPQNTLLEKAMNIFGSQIGPIILETENLDHTLGSIENFKKMLN